MLLDLVSISRQIHAVQLPALNVGVLLPVNIFHRSADGLHRVHRQAAREAGRQYDGRRSWRAIFPRNRSSTSAHRIRDPRPCRGSGHGVARALPARAERGGWRLALRGEGGRLSPAARPQGGVRRHQPDAEGAQGHARDPHVPGSGRVPSRNCRRVTRRGLVLAPARQPHSHCGSAPGRHADSERAHAPHTCTRHAPRRDDDPLCLNRSAGRRWRHGVLGDTHAGARVTSVGTAAVLLQNRQAAGGRSLGVTRWRHRHKKPTANSMSLILCWNAAGENRSC